MASSDSAVLTRATRAEESEFSQREKKPVQISGSAVIDPESGELECLVVDSLADQLKMAEIRAATQEFFNPKPIDQILDEQGVKPFQGFGDRGDPFADDQEHEEFLAWIKESRSAS